MISPKHASRRASSPPPSCKPDLEAHAFAECAASTAGSSLEAGPRSRELTSRSTSYEYPVFEETTNLRAADALSHAGIAKKEAMQLKNGDGARPPPSRDAQRRGLPRVNTEKRNGALTRDPSRLDTQRSDSRGRKRNAADADQEQTNDESKREMRQREHAKRGSHGRARENPREGVAKGRGENEGDHLRKQVAGVKVSKSDRQSGGSSPSSLAALRPKHATKSRDHEAAQASFRRGRNRKEGHTEDDATPEAARKRELKKLNRRRSQVRTQEEEDDEEDDGSDSSPDTEPIVFPRRQQPLRYFRASKYQALLEEAKKKGQTKKRSSALQGDLLSLYGGVDMWESSEEDDDWSPEKVYGRDQARRLLRNKQSESSSDEEDDDENDDASGASENETAENSEDDTDPRVGRAERGEEKKRRPAGSGGETRELMHIRESPRSRPRQMNTRKGSAPCKGSDGGTKSVDGRGDVAEGDETEEPAKAAYVKTKSKTQAADADQLPRRRQRKARKLDNQ
ncbi:hypothetical protein BESB_066730 [Besnoitia besnoiti]|uniref:Uncharacterized protein n=1 Tax=Besnoitia besnoiti TaxID=94643 RepID=A0A2A9MGT7_BESBE|nr:hypothetical protein BESB_066730 [Besnoitia besnoiti]PFH34640.1 hypothetical protein BESB_066730 [Besnoitia besnoiti]